MDVKIQLRGWQLFLLLFICNFFKQDHFSLLYRLHFAIIQQENGELLWLYICTLKSTHYAIKWFLEKNNTLQTILTVLHISEICISYNICLSWIMKIMQTNVANEWTFSLFNETKVLLVHKHCFMNSSSKNCIVYCFLRVVVVAIIQPCHQ